MMKNLDLENLEPHDREVKISISSQKLKKVSRRSVINIDISMPIQRSSCWAINYSAMQLNAYIMNHFVLHYALLHPK